MGLETDMQEASNALAIFYFLNRMVDIFVSIFLLLFKYCLCILYML